VARRKGEGPGRETEAGASSSGVGSVAAAAAERAKAVADLRRFRRQIDALDKRIVALLNQRASLARSIGEAKAVAGRRAIRDADREREVLLRVAMANEGPMPQADLLALYRRLIAATRGIEAADRRRGKRVSEAGDGD